MLGEVAEEINGKKGEALKKIINNHTIEITDNRRIMKNLEVNNKRKLDKRLALQPELIVWR